MSNKPQVTGPHLGEFEQLVLLALLHLGEEAYGIKVSSELQRRAGRRVSLGTVYTTLARMEAKGLVESRIGDPRRSGVAAGRSTT